MSNSSTSIFSSKFLYTFISSLVLFVLWTLGHELLAHKLDNSFIKDLLKLKSGNSNCLIIGDSHTNDSFRNTISECESLALGGVTIPMIEDALISSIKTNNLKRVVIGFAPHYFSDKRLSSTSNAYFQITEWFTPYPNLITSNALVQKIIGRYQKNDYDYSIFFKKFPIRNEKSWASRTIEYKQRKSMQAIKDHKISIEIVKSKYWSHFLRILKVLKDNNIESCFINTPNLPVYHTGIRKYLKKQEWNQVISYIKNNNHTYIDFNEIVEVPETLFKDPEHLTLHGSQKYAKAMIDSCFTSY